MLNSSELYAGRNNLCHARKEPMAPRVQARLDIVGENYIKAFWLGLFEGDGSMFITINHTSKRVHGISFSIEMNYNPENELMLHAVAAVVGGGVAITRRNKSVKWTVGNRENVVRLLEILKEFPPLTTKSRARRNWIMRVFDKRYIEKTSREEIYTFTVKERKKLPYTKHLFSLKDYNNIAYIEPWLSGFIEAEGSWSAKAYVKGKSGLTKDKAGWTKFELTQKDEKPLLQFIGKYFGSTTPRVYPKQNTHYLRLGNRASLKLRYRHLHANPFLGYKGVQFEAFFKVVRDKKQTYRVRGEYIDFSVPQDSLFVKIREHPLIYALPLEEEEKINPPPLAEN